MSIFSVITKLLTKKTTQSVLKAILTTLYTIGSMIAVDIIEHTYINSQKKTRKKKTRPKTALVVEGEISKGA